MDEYRLENRTLWEALSEYIGPRTIAWLARKSQRLDCSVDVKTLGRWKKAGEVPDKTLLRARKLLEALGVDWRARLRKPVYDFNKSYSANIKDGPFGAPVSLPPDVPTLETNFLGRTVDSPIGLAASVATANSQWIGFYADLGYDIITYKTVRDVEEVYPAHTPPNLVWLENAQAAYPLGDLPGEFVLPAEETRATPRSTPLTLANSVGVPSAPTSVWTEDIARTRERLHPTKVLIVSVIGTGNTPQEIRDSFVSCALHAARQRPDAIELNLSCPNTFSDKGQGLEGLLYQDPKGTATLLEVVRKALRQAGVDLPIFLKIGYLGLTELTALVNATRRSADGYTAINTMPASVCRKTYNGHAVAVFSRPHHDSRAGISGFAIREHSRATVAGLADLRQRKDEFSILGVGGVCDPRDVTALMGSGADIVQCCSVALVDRFFAINARRELSHERPFKKAPDRALAVVSHPDLANLVAAADEESLNLTLEQMRSEIAALDRERVRRRRRAGKGKVIAARPATLSRAEWVERLKRRLKR